MAEPGQGACCLSVFMPVCTFHTHPPFSGIAGAPPFREDLPVQYPKYDAKPSKTPTSKTFVFGNEDHTLGNSLRHVLMQE
jgi:hypothetical protein